VFVSARGVSGLAPEQFTVVGRNLFFFTDVASGTPALWRYDGKSSSAALVSRGRFHNVQDYVTSSGNALYFRAYDAEHGFEMWRSDGTDEGTRVLKDVLPGPESGMPGEYPDYPVGLPSHGLVLFRAGDPVRGLELWVSDGTEAGTHPVADLGRGTRSSDPHAFTRIGEYVCLSADDGTHGAELWRFTLPPPGDLTPPVVTCPATVWAEATSAEGGLVTLPAAKATDEGPTPPVVTYSPASGSLFPMGMTLVTAAARDAAGNVEVCSFEVWVRDSTPPVLTCPANKVVEATSPAGASVSYPPIPVSDNMTPSSSMSVTYSHPSGTTFPLGTTSPGAWAFDAMGNFGYCVFTITVKDTTGPTLTCPADVVVEALGPTGARAAYGTATASDAVSSPVSVVYSQASDSEFPVGTTRVTVTAKDKLANASSCSFGVTVRDSTAPVVTCPEPLTLEATDATGAIASFPEATAMDSVTGSPEVTYSHAPGSTFPVGDTTVTATATDVAGNTARCTFGVTVRDTTPPSLTCPADVEVEARDDASARPVEYPAATVGDAGMGAPRVVYSRASGSDFPVGTTPVDVTATDGMGNRASCSFRVTVKPPPKPDTGGDAGGDEDEDEEEDKGGGLGCASTGSSSMGLWGALTLLSWLASWRPRARRR
jgi:ELWxxDGT repeat protein